ncbi:MAG: trigger factor, partial [Phycisphaerae bacterium]
MSQIENVDPSAADGGLSDENFIQSCQFEIEVKSPVERSVRVTVPESLLKSEYENTMALTSTQVALPGFRRGRVPKRILEKRFGEDLRKEFLTTTIRRTLEAVVTQNHFRVLGEAAIEPEDLVLPREGPLTYTLLLEIVPEIPLPDLTTIDLVRPKFEVTEERIGKAFDHLRRTMGVMRPQRGPIESEDQTFVK